MKKILLTIFTIGLLFMSSDVFAAACTVGTLTETPRRNADHIRVLSLVWVSDASGDVNGTTNCTVAINGYVYMVVTDPSATAPTTLYDITLTDADSMDIMEGKLADRSATASEQEIPTVGGVPMSRYVKGDLTVVVDNAGNATGGTIVIYVYEED